MMALSNMSLARPTEFRVTLGFILSTRLPLRRFGHEWPSFLPSYLEYMEPAEGPLRTTFLLTGPYDVHIRLTQCI